MFNEEEINSLETSVLKSLKAFREERNISQLELSLISGVSQNMITYIETGKRTPSLRTLLKLCNALEISPAKLFENNNSEKEALKKLLIESIQKYL
ncbi:MAG: helix-turn-helix transcriptional regulator [Spirochaetaceae bacterium]|nr:helix-turn-helix transcriptional regulator [Spirochaetaceae bacterium]